MQNRNQTPLTKRRKPLIALLAVAAITALLSGTSCHSVVENRDPVGQRFPEVRGETLEGETVELPLAEPTILLVGYDQDAQFDADRWLIGLLQAPPAARIIELPTIPGLFPRVIAGRIDSGMRSGIPSEDWQSVVTLYGDDASEVMALTGNERGRNMRVLFLDDEGSILWFHDRGFSASKVLELGRAVAEHTSTASE